MDPLTIFGAVTGGISATSEILKLLQWAVATANKFQVAPELALATMRDVRMIHRNLMGFGRLQEKWRLVPQDRLSCIPLEDAKNTLVDCVSSLDELEDVLKPLNDPSQDTLSLSSRLEWVMKDSRIADLSNRLHNAQSSLGLMLTIMQHESVIEVSTAVTSLAEVTKRIAQDVADILAAKGLVPGTTTGLGQALAAMGDDTSTIRAGTTRPESVIIPPTPLPTGRESMSSVVSWAPQRFAFEQDLEQSIAYRRMPRWSKEDLSFRSSVLNFHALSFLSNLSLGDVSALSVVALPIFRSDISNSRHYGFGDRPIALDSDVASTDYPPAQLEPPTQALPIPPAPPSPPASPFSPQTAKRTSYLTAPLSKVTTLLRFRRKAESDSLAPPLLAASPDISTDETPTPPRTPTSRPLTPAPRSDADGGAQSGIIDISLSIQGIFSLAQLSELSVDPDDYSLSHRAGGMPCFSIVGTVGFQERYPQSRQNPIEAMETARRLQLKIAARRGNLDFFSCKTCYLSLAQIVTEEKSSWTRAELWCGENDCAMKLATATPFSVCSCYEQMKQFGTVEKFYGCRNLASMMVQCARCFDKCARCMEEESKGSCLLQPCQQRVPATVWRKRLYDFQDMLFASQTRIIDAIDEPGLNLKLAILDRESTRFDTILEALNTRELLLDERKTLRRMMQGLRAAAKGPRPEYGSQLHHHQLVREKLISVNGKLKEYGELFGGKIAGEHLEILSERAHVLLVRRHLIAPLIRRGPTDTVLKAQLAVYAARWEALVHEMKVASRKNPLPETSVANGISKLSEAQTIVPGADRGNRGYLKDWPLKSAPEFI